MYIKVHNNTLHVYKDLLEIEISWVIGRWKSDKQALHVRGRCIDSFKFLSHTT